MGAKQGMTREQFLRTFNCAPLLRPLPQAATPEEGAMALINEIQAQLAALTSSVMRLFDINKIPEEPELTVTFGQVSGKNGLILMAQTHVDDLKNLGDRLGTFVRSLQSFAHVQFGIVSGTDNAAALTYIPGDLIDAFRRLSETKTFVYEDMQRLNLLGHLWERLTLASYYFPSQRMH